MKITKDLYRPWGQASEKIAAEARRMERMRGIGSFGEGIGRLTPGQRWYAAQVERGRREAQDLARRRGWGLAGRFPSEALEAE